MSALRVSLEVWFASRLDTLLGRVSGDRKRERARADGAVHKYSHPQPGLMELECHDVGIDTQGSCTVYKLFMMS